MLNPLIRSTSVETSLAGTNTCFELVPMSKVRLQHYYQTDKADYAVVAKKGSKKLHSYFI